MAKKKHTQPAEVTPEVVKPTRPVFKSRFGGLVKAEAGKMPSIATSKTIEGNEYYEFEGLEGVYFSAKMFV